MVGKIKLFIKKLQVPFVVSKTFVVQFSWSFLIQELDQTFFFRGSLYQNTSTDERGRHSREIGILWDMEMLLAEWARHFKNVL